MTNHQSPIYIADYNYPLPDERIAKYPLAERDQSKLLVYRDGQTISRRIRYWCITIRELSRRVWNSTSGAEPVSRCSAWSL